MRIVFIVLFVILLYRPIFGQKALSIKQIRQLDSIATQDVPKNAPGIATAIIKNGKVIYEQYAGYAALVDSTLIQYNTRFNIASNGKQFTALAILSLIDAKKLALDDDIRKWFPRLYPTIKETITVQSLLNHTSGIRDCYDLWALQGYTWWEKSFDNNDVLALIENQVDLNFTPNSRYLYSNTNYILLALLVEKVTQKTFTDFTNELFAQLNMPNTSFENNYKIISGPIARAYFNFTTWTTFPWIWNVVGDGNIFSTLQDQIHWEQLVQGKGNTKFNRKIIAQSQQVIDHSNFTNYGYGLEFGEYKDIAYTFHEGATGAWKATTIRFPEKNLSLITLTNSGKTIPYTQTRQMADVVLGLSSIKNYVKTKPESVGSYVSEEELVGTYVTESDFAFTFQKRDTTIYLQRVGRNEVALEREAANIFHQKYDTAFKQEFTKNTNGKMQVTAYYTDHAPYTMTKVDEIPTNFDVTKINGTYFNAETNTHITINYLDAKNYQVTFRNEYKTKGLLLTTHKMMVDLYTLTFVEDTLLLNGDRIKNVVYTKQ